MNPNFVRSLFLVALVLPSWAFATRYRIDPRPPVAAGYEMTVTNPLRAFDMVAPEASRSLTLLNFIADDEPETTEGVDFPRYDRRRQFGSWILPDPQENCYDTRADVLMRDSKVPVTFSGQNPCRVKTGRWHDPYTDVDFTDAGDVQIDHVVPLKNAYVAGAWKWTREERCHYANFTAYDSHLLTVSGRENMRKGDRSPAEYMPPNPQVACAYLQRWLNVKAVWDLTLAEDEASEIQRLVHDLGCGVRFQTVTETTFNNLRAKAARISSACARD